MNLEEAISLLRKHAQEDRAMAERWRDGLTKRRESPDHFEASDKAISSLISICEREALALETVIAAAEQSLTR